MKEVRVDTAAYFTLLHALLCCVDSVVALLSLLLSIDIVVVHFCDLFFATYFLPIK